MPRKCKIVVVYLDGTTTEFFGGLHLSEGILNIYPSDCGKQTVRIPLVNIRHYVTEG